MKRILVVDDDVLFLNSISNLLEGEGFEIIKVSNGKDALAKLETEHVPLVIMDYNMPGMNGVQLAEFISQKEIECQTILITAYGTFDLATEALENNVFTILQKPLDSSRLINVVNEAFQKLNETGEHRLLKDINERLLLQKADLTFRSHEYQTVFESIADPVVILNTDLRVVRANKAALQMARFDFNEEPCCHQFYGLSNETYCSDCPARRVMKTGQSANEKFYDEVSHKIYHIVAYPVFSDDGEIRRIVELRKDVTEVANLEEKLMQFEQQNERINLAAEVGHEIRNFLMIISGYASVISSNVKKNNFDRVASNLHALNDGISRIIDYADSLMQRNLEDHKKTTVDLVSFVEKFVEFMRPHKLFTSIRFEISKSVELLPVDINETHLHQILTNLLKNAAEAIVSGTIRIELSQSESGRLACISIHDDGPGISGEVISRIFQNQITTKESGHGYGLMVVQKLIESNHGRITVDSKKGKGTTFTLTFDLAGKYNRTHA